MSSLRHSESQRAFAGALPLEASKVLLVAEGSAFATFIREGPTAPRDEGDTQVQGEAVGETDPTCLEFDGGLGRVGGGPLVGREGRLHDGVLLKRGATRVTPECRCLRRKGVRRA